MEDEKVNQQIQEEKIRELVNEGTQEERDSWIRDNIHELTKSFIEMYNDEFISFCNAEYNRENE